MAVLLAVVYLILPGRAQAGEISVFKGEIHSDAPVNFQEYFIELEEINHRGDLFRAELRMAGEFEIRNIPAGEYQLRITNLHGETVQQEVVSVNPSVGVLNLQFNAPRKAPSAPGTISIRQLQHPPDRRAIQSFAAAQRFAASGNTEKAAEELQKAVALSPQFADAYTNLAVQHIRLQRFLEATAEMTRAIAIAGPNPLRLCNLAYAQLNLGRVEDSLASVRSALSMDSSYPQAHLILGSILAGNRRTLPEAIPHLERAAASIPSARAVLERAQKALQQ